MEDEVAALDRRAIASNFGRIPYGAGKTGQLMRLAPHFLLTTQANLARPAATRCSATTSVHGAPEDVRRRRIVCRKTQSSRLQVFRH